MPSPSPVRFSEARQYAFQAARTVAAQGFHVVLARDVLGCFSLIVDDTGKQEATALREGWEADFTRHLGRYRSDEPVLLASQMFSADAVLNSPRAMADVDAYRDADPAAAGSVRFIDNTVVGEDWTRVSLPHAAPIHSGVRAHRTALYGFKGGVGRTTATAVLARHLADRGRSVLVVDLDLESPGAGPLLAGRDLPRDGIVDQLVEDAVGNADGLELVTRTGYVPRDRYGELWVAPARGRAVGDQQYEYVDKLNRVYSDIPGASFAARLEQAVRACEDFVEREGDTGRRPDVVLLDSRAGIHDIAAVAISQLCDVALLFGADNTQTWTGYGDLFAAWQSSGQAHRIREKLHMVASMVPDSVHFSMRSYLESFRAHAYECCMVLYDEIAPGGQGRGEDAVADVAAVADIAESAEASFAPSLHDDWAPHAPIPILFDQGLVGMDPVNAPGWWDRAFVRAAYGEFLDTVAPLVEGVLDSAGDQEGTA
ncbi:KGGVGR-motif variant AAA ATPase [Streptomyces sp. NRRL S-1868]|uniref:KGGVGR-motif variant AAA ATPase n=1 Tax=Streptomyces sp. NRRL S-1868 TaxID=1463892 RepID=UPI0004C67EE2|nr:AAA family ATPase [Streptomyces sp. NRRL S-1868]